MPFATITVGDLETTIQAGEYLTIGSGGASDLRISHPYVSRRHALVGYKNGWFIEDLGSSNGTFINRIRIGRGEIGRHTQVSLGSPDVGVDLVIQTSGETETPYAGEPANYIGPLPAILDPEILSTLTLPPRLQPAILTPIQTFEGGLEVRDLGFTVERGKVIMEGVSFNAMRGTLTAVVGPSGAGKSTLASLVSGINVPSGGSIEFDGISIVHDYTHAKEHIGLVPQDDVLHRQLRLGTALKYAARLRLPDMTPTERQNQINKAVAQLDLEPHLNTRIDRLSGGQRKRASVAMELLTEPELLILDEPTSGLDPALDRQLMEEFRKLANGGRTVLVITHSVAHLAICDQVLVLAPGGKTSFIGREEMAFSHFEATDWSYIFGQLQSEPEACAEKWQQVQAPLEPLSRPRSQYGTEIAGKTGFWTQLGTLITRQLALLFADRGYSAFLFALPFVVGLLPLVAPGDAGLTQVQTAKNAWEPEMVLALLVIGSTFMGISMSIRDLIGEKTIYLRERAVGLSPAAYLASKVTVLGIFGWIGAAIIVLVLSLVKDLPTGDGILGLGATTELFISVALTINMGMILGLLLSSLVTSQNQAMPVLVVVLMLQMVLNGGLISLSETVGLNIASYFAPARWGYMMGAVSIDLPALLEIADEADRAIMETTGGPIDAMWTHDTEHWLSAFSVLTGMAIIMLSSTWLRLRTVKH